MRTDFLTGGSFTVSQFKAEQGNSATSWSPSRNEASFAASDYLTEFDCSGLGYHTAAAAASAPTWSSDSPVYDGGYHISSLNWLPLYKLPFEAFGEGTVTFWMKVNAFESWDHYLLIANSFNWNGNESDFLIVARSNSSASTITFDCCSNSVQYTPSLGRWFHTAIQFDLKASNYKLYINGILYSQKSDSKINSTYASKHNYCAIGNAFASTSYQSDCDFSDFRIYSTALTASDIKSLFETRFSLSSNGSFYIKELSEQDTSKCSLKSNGTLQAAAAEEGGNLLKITASQVTAGQFIES